jgi:hypothetical protein
MKLTQAIFISFFVATSSLPAQKSELTSLPFISGAEQITGLDQASVQDDALLVTYPANSFKSPSTGGFQFISRPIPESDEMTLSYTIDVPADFDFVKGYIFNSKK